jgi:hypothetical protein
MNELKILLANDRNRFRPSETLKGVAGWRLPAAPRSADVRLFWYTRGKGTEDVGVINRFAFEQPQAEEGRPFQFVLPEEPYSFSGRLVSLIWALELVVEPGSQTTRVEFTLSPTGEEILLHADAQAHARSR